MAPRLSRLPFAVLSAAFLVLVVLLGSISSCPNSDPGTKPLPATSKSGVGDVSAGSVADGGTSSVIAAENETVRGAVLSPVITKPQKGELVVRCFVRGPLQDSLEPLSIQLSTMDSTDGRAHRLSATVASAQPSFEFRDNAALGEKYRKGESLRLVLLEGSRELDFVVLRRENEQMPEASSSTGDLVESVLTFPSPTIVAGIVEDSLRHPVADARVYLAAEESVGLASPMRVASVQANSAKTSSEGAFAFRVRGVRRAILAISHYRFEIRSLQISLPQSGRLDVGAIQLSAGAAISGVIRPATPEYPLHLIRMVAWPSFLDREGFDKTLLTLDDLIVRKRGSTLTRYTVESQIDEGGRFAVGGLLAGPYALSVNPAKSGIVLMSGEPGFPVEAPSAGIDLRWDSPLVIVHVVNEGGPMSGTMVDVQNVSGVKNFRGRSDDGGRFYLAARVGERILISADSPDYAHAAIEVVAGGRGEVIHAELALRKVEHSTSLTLDVSDFDGRPVPNIAYALIPAGTRVSDGAWVRELSNEEGHYEIDDIEAGSYSIEVRSNKWWRPSDFNMPSRFQLLLEEGKRIAKRIQLEKGGQLLVSTEDEDRDSPAYAECELRSLTNELLVPAFHYPGQVRVLEEMRLPVLRPGTYVIAAELDGYEPTRETVEVMEGRRTRVQLHMRRRR